MEGPYKHQWKISLGAFKARLEGDPEQPDLMAGNPVHGGRVGMRRSLRSPPT